MYHYTECGLDNVWLVNGYHVEKIDGEEYVSFEDADELHGVIGRSLAEKPTLTGAEVRFLRKEIGMSQRLLAQFLGTTEQTVSLWERGANVPDSEARLMKAVYLEKVDGNVSVVDLLQHLIELDRKDSEKLVFEDTEEGWKIAA
ncbi:DNA-binding transcriptional regulator [Bordetella sp. N]|uniref:helix-turn-helix domain-containing protein n=1 Tax=Bordetella sp. N TaxID=1746199 RepID=UPI00070C38E8|nr:helix-turn-helix domain-containing protein [Bordetella sp. N]ALM84123.1 transcriptional regulator [Bordetella sp. N]